MSTILAFIIVLLIIVSVPVLVLTIAYKVCKKLFKKAKSVLTNLSNDMSSKLDNIHVDKNFSKTLLNKFNFNKKDDKINIEDIRQEFDKAIKEAEQDYVDSYQPYIAAKSLLEKYEANKEELIKLIDDNDTKCKHLMELNKVSEARIFAKQRQDAINRVQVLMEEMKNLEIIINDAMEARNDLLFRANELKWNKDYIISQLELSIKSEELYEKLYATTDSSKKDLVKAIKESIENSKTKTKNYKDLYNGTKHKDIDHILNDKEVEDYLDSLKVKEDTKTSTIYKIK